MVSSRSSRLVSLHLARYHQCPAHGLRSSGGPEIAPKPSPSSRPSSMSSSRAGWRSAAFLAATRSSHGDWAPLRAEPTTSACACACDHRSPRRRPPVLQPRPRHSRIRVCLQRPWSPPSTGCLASARAVMLASQSSILVGPSVVRFARQCFRAQGGSRELNRLPLTCSCPAPAPLADRSTARGSRLCSQIAALLAPQTRLVAPEACRARRLPFKPRLLLSRGQAILAVDAMIHHLPPTRLRPAWPRWHRAQRCVPLRSLSRSLARSLRASTWVHPPSNHSSQPTTPTNNANASSPAETFLRRRSGRQSNQSSTVVRQSGTVRGGQTARPSPGVPAVTPPPGTARCALAFSNSQPGITEGKPVEDR